MATSARKENRWKRIIITRNNEIEDRQREVEAAFMTHCQSSCSHQKKATTRQQVRSWMRRNVEDYDCSTKLAEAANVVFDLPMGAMDDETHWVWSEALSSFELGDK